MLTTVAPSSSNQKQTYGIMCYMDRTFSKILTDVMNSSGLTGKELATKLHVTRPTVSRWRNGHNAPERATAEAIERILGVTDGRLVRAWQRDMTGSELAPWQERLPWLERNSRVMEVASPHMIYAVLQSPAYTKFSLAQGMLYPSEQDLQAEVDMRQKQYMAFREHADTKVIAVLPRASFSSLPDRVRKEQVELVLSLMDSSRIEVHLIPDSTPMFLVSILLVFRIRDGGVAVANEHNFGVSFWEDTKDVSWASERFSRFLGLALPGAESRKHLERLRK